MRTNKKTTTPKPFVFVLMPFKAEFKDIYEFGIKGAADDVGAYAERVDEQYFTEAILDRIFNQINKADVVVADMTGKNPNVFYEVGYAHALGKIVILLTQNAADIPFDLQHRLHLDYEGQITNLRFKLGKTLRWAIQEAKKRASPGSSEHLSVYIEGQPLPENGLGRKPPTINFRELGNPSLQIEVRNDSSQTFLGSSHIYLMCEDEPPIVPCRVRIKKIKRHVEDDATRESFEEETEEEEYDPLRPIPIPRDAATGNFRVQYKLPNTIPPLPPYAVDLFEIRMSGLRFIGKSSRTNFFRLRLHSSVTHYEFDFYLED